MSPAKYFSERELGTEPRIGSEITDRVWGGIATAIQSRTDDGSFGASYPAICPDGAGTYGTNEHAFSNAMLAEIPRLENLDNLLSSNSPSTLVVMDMIEFCWRAVGLPESYQFHSFFRHNHFNFDIEAGRAKFREDINLIFRRNGLAYELKESGEIYRLAPIGLREMLDQTVFSTGDDELNAMLEIARQKFLDPDELVRREALEKLWDAWERLKTLESGNNKKAQATALLNSDAKLSGQQFRKMLEDEANALTNIGNGFKIRHHETNQERLNHSNEVDYLFHRLFCFINLLLRATGRGA